MKANFNTQKIVRNSRSISALGALRKLQGLGLLLCSLLIGSSQVWGTEYSFTFAKGDLTTSSTSFTKSDVTWTLSDTEDQWNGTANQTGYVFGSGSNTKPLTVSTSGISGTITQVTVTGRSNNATKTATVSVTVGSTNFQATDAIWDNGNNQTLTFTGSASGTISVHIEPNQCGHVLLGISVTYSAGSTLYTVTFDANGGSVTPASATQASAGAAITLPTPTRDGYNCTGWYTAKSGGTKRGDAGGSYTPTASETIHAQWSAKTYTNYRTTCEAPKTLDHITIDTDPTKLIYLVGETVNTTGAVVTAHYTDDTSSDVTASVTWTAPSGVLSAGLDQALTASYTLGDVTKTATHNVIDVYAVTLLKKDETGATISGELSDAPAVSLTSVNQLTAAETGNQYTFWKWEVSNGSLSSTSSLTPTIDAVSGAITITAIYYKPITVTWSVNGSVYSGPSIHSHGWNTIYPSDPTPASVGCEGKVFIGWSRTPDYRSDDTAPTDMVESGEAITKDEHFYAVFADKESEGTAPEWTKTALGSVTAGTYLICTTNGKPFNGTMSSGHGQPTGSAFSSANWALDVFNEDAPTGAQEIIFSTNGSGWKMYVEGRGYLYATKASSGGFSYQNDAGEEYWSAASSAWKYSKDYSGKNAYLRVYSSTFRTYNSSTGGDAGIILLKKTAAGSPAVYSDYTTSCTCKGFSFHTGSGTDEAVKTTNTRTCFEQVDASTTWKIDDYVIPSDTKFFVGWQDEFKSSGLGSSRSSVQTWAAEMYFEYSKNYGDGWRKTVGAATGAVGTLRIWSDNNWNNCHVGFDPNGYIFKLGSTNLEMHDATSGLDGAQYKETDVVTLTSSDISSNYQVNLYTGSAGGVACDNSVSKAMTTMGVKSGSGDSWRGKSVNAGTDANTKGFFRIDLAQTHTDTKNWNAHWVPCYELTFDLKDGTGTIVTTPEYVSVEAASKVVTIPNTVPTKDGYRFMGWSDDDNNTVEYAAGSTHNVTLSGNKTVYAVWKQEFTVTYNYAGGSADPECAGGSYIAGEAVTVCTATLTKTASTFNGWSYSPSVTVSAGQFTMPESDVVITATWGDREYTLTHNGSNYTKTENKTTIKSGDTPFDLHYTCTGTYAFPKSISITGGGKSWTMGTDYTWAVAGDKQSATLHINESIISADVTIEITMQTRYTVVWDEHGITSTEYYASDDNDVTMQSGIADCGEKKFYGWTEDAEFVSNPTTPPTMASSGAISGDKHYYAIFADAVEPANPGYMKVTSISAGTYIIASASKAYGGDDTAVDASPSDGVIASLPSGAKELTVTLGTGDNTGYFAISYDNSGTTTYIYGGDRSLSTTTTANYNWSLGTGTYAGEIISKYTNGSKIYYLQQNGSVFRCYTHTQTIAYMYKKQTTTYSNFAKTCTLYDIDIADTDDGIVTTTPSAGTGVAGEGQTVTVNVTPNSCKYLSALKYNDGSDHAISIASTPYTFTMPASNVTVTATFADKTVSRIDPVTSAYRALMQNTSFVGEQIRVTYNNGETEDLAWDNASLTFSGYTMSTLGEQMVSVAYSGSCGSANTSYSIEITDGIPVTFSDCGITTVRKYEPGDVVPVETTAGEYACSGWEFVGWSESSVAANSTSFTPVRNFNASTARTLYAVYANVGTDWISAFNTSELRGGATYVIVYRGYDYDYALLNTVASTNYLNGQQLATACSTITEPGSPTKDRYVLEDTPTSAMKWQLVQNGDYYSLYNAATNKYLKITTDQHALLTSSCEDKFTIANGYNDSQLSLKSFNASASNYYLYWYNSGTYFEGWTTAQGLFLLTNVETFSSTPPCAPQAAIFHGNGGTVIASGGSPTGGDLTIREATRDAGITTPIAEYEDCDGMSWSFIGWANHEVDVTRVPILTTELLNDGGGNKSHTITTDGEEFWAIYTNQGEALTKYGTISFSMSDFSGNYLSEEHTVTKVVSGDNYVFGDKRIGHASETGIQFEAVNGEFYNKTSLGKINSISFGSFAAGALSNLRVYVGNSEKATTYEMTAAELQVVGGVSTYYPTHDCEYVYIKSGGTYACVTSISIDFGKGTKVWATTPDCKRVTLSGDIYATSTNGRGIMAVTPLHVNAFQLGANAGIVISSNSSDVYFSTDRNANFAKAAANQPKSTVTVHADAAGNLSTDVYVHYKPSSAGDGVPADVNVYANLAVPDPSVTATHPIHVRNIPEKFVVAAKVGATWYALPADMNAETNPSGVVIEVDETNMTATAPNTCSYTIWPVKTTNSEYDRYAINTAHYDGNAYGERVRFSAVNNSNKGLWANNANSGNGISNYAAITSASDGGTTENTNPAYEWKITTTVVDGKWQYTLQTDQTQNDRYLRYWFAATGGPKWGTYASGEQNLYFLPVTEVEPFEMQVVEWYPTKVLVQTEAAFASPSVKVNGEAVANPVMTNKGGKLWEISGLPLESNPTQTITVSFTADEKNYACSKAIPVILSRSTKTQASEPFATLGAAIYNNADLVVRDGAVLTVEGSNAANTFNDVTIYPTSKISVPSDKKLTVHSLTFFGGIDEIYDGSAYAINKYGVPELSLKGTLHKSIAQIDYVMRVDDSQMYSLTVPYDVNLADITYWDGTNMGTPGDKLWVSAYDGDARAKKDMSHTWIWEANFASKGLEEKLKAGVGYTISADLQAGVGSTYSILRMPMASNVAADATELAKTVAVTAHGIDSDVSDNHKGWNLVGNPYMVAISGAEADSKLVVGYLRETGTGPWEWVNDDIRYVTIPADNGQDYWQEKFSSATLKPFKNFFLQIANTGDLSFALASRQNAPERYLEVKEHEVEFEINLADANRQDHTGLLIAEKYSPAYEINADLEKMIGAMSVYTIYGGYNLAYNALSPTDAAQLIPVGYVAPSAGEYTFSLDDDSDVSEVEHIYLTDYQESVTVDLMEQDYTFMYGG